MEIEVVSPELALVDPELAARARALLPDPPNVSPPATAVVPERREIPATTRRRIGVPLIVASLALNILLLGRALEPAGEGSPAQATRATEPREAGGVPVRASGIAAATAVKRSKDGRVHVGDARLAPKSSRAVLSWARSPSAARYDVVVWSDHRRVLDLWTTNPRVDLTTLPCAERQKLEPRVRYLWFVYPLMRGHARFGPLRAWGSIVLPHASRCGAR